MSNRDIVKNWTNHLRKSRQFSCPCCRADIRPPTIDGFKKHIQSSAAGHPKEEKDIQQAFERMKLSSSKSQYPVTDHDLGKRSKKRSGATALDNQGDSLDMGNLDAHMDDSDNERGNKKLCSPRNSPPPSTPKCGRGGQFSENVRETDRGINGSVARQLWSPEDGSPAKSPQPRSTQSTGPGPRPKHLHQLKLAQPDVGQLDLEEPVESPSVTRMIHQPPTRPISQEQLVAEVKGIYAGLVMVESKCIEVDNAQSANKDSLRHLSNEQWQALIALHRTLLNEHHDFFLASQHPFASPALRRLASKYAMPARMWRHAIHSFLELLRHNLPLSLEPMLTFIYIAYSMMALLYETVPAFEDTWIECLGDLGRYRMAIEDDDIRDRETWTAVSRYWYSKASDKSPTTGRLYHHLAILARPNALQQVYYYTKSLCVPSPFLSARESVMTLFDPVLSPAPPRMEPIDLAFVRIHAILFSDKGKELLVPSTQQFLSLLDEHIARITKSWLQSGYFIGISIICSLLGYGNESNVLKMMIAPTPSDGTETAEEMSLAEIAPPESFHLSLSFAIHTLEIVIRRWGDMNILPYLHTQMVFLYHLSKFPAGMSYVESRYPWKLTAMMLNYLKQSCKFQPRMDSGEFPGVQKLELPRPLPEDYAMRGLIYTEDYFPTNWFSNEAIEEDEKYFEQASMTDARKERILWLGRRISVLDKWLIWNGESGEFSVAAKYDIDLANAPAIDAADIRDDIHLEMDVYDLSAVDQPS